MPLNAFRLSIALLCTTLIGAISPAAAQDQSPNDILEASRSALAEISGFSAQFKMGGEGGSMFKDTLPSMSGQLFFGTNEEFGRVLHGIGESRDQQTMPLLPIDILIASDRYLWTDIPSRIINERPVSSKARGLPSAFPLVLLKSIIQEDPFANDADNAETIDLLTQETVNGTLCDVIHIKRNKPKGRTSRSGSDAYTDARWYIGVQDKLPRKLEHITDAGLIKITLAFELAGLKVIEPTQDQLDVTRPDGFKLKSTMPVPNADPITQIEPNLPLTQPRINPTPSQPITNRPLRAPAYAFTTQVDSKVNNATQTDRVTVLYFWGSWCIPCTTASPLVSTMTEQFGSAAIDVFGIAIREADPSRTASGFSLKKYQHSLVLDGDALVSSFKVRVFPTIIVINQIGEIVFQQSISKEISAEKLIENATTAAENAITSG